MKLAPAFLSEDKSARGVEKKTTNTISNENLYREVCVCTVVRVYIMSIGAAGQPTNHCTL